MNSQADESVKRIADSTVRRLSAYLRFLEDFEGRGLTPISSEELAKRGGTTSAQVRKDLSFFGSFGKRGLGYSVPELKKELREILGLGKESLVPIFDSNPAKIGTKVEGMQVADIAQMEKDFARDLPDIVVLTVPAEAAQPALDPAVRAPARRARN